MFASKNNLENPSTSENSSVTRLESILKLQEFKDITVNYIKTTNVIHVSRNQECTQFDVSCILRLNTEVDFQIMYPNVKLFNNDIPDISKLRINIKDVDIRHEMRSCTNYLQRQKNISLALFILKKCVKLIGERKIILDVLSLHINHKLEITVQEEGGILITCTDIQTNRDFFKALWKINFNCIDHEVLDITDFEITLRNRSFHHTVKPILKRLIQPNLPLNIKFQCWWAVIEAINSSVVHDIEDAVGVPFVRVHNIELQDNDYEMIESDDNDSCVVIE